MSYPEAEQIKDLVDKAQKVVIVQADNPDSDSLGSALALEHILGEMGKEPYLYCAVNMPTYIRYLKGWDRVSDELPKEFDASILVDVSTMTLFEKLGANQAKLAAKPCIVLDHHETVENQIPFAAVMINDHVRASAGELIYRLAKQLGWPLPLGAQECVLASVLGDTQGLSNQSTTPETYRLVAELIEQGVDRPKLEEARRELGKMPPEIYRYKASLITRTEFADDGKIAFVSLPQTEINEYSPLYNPGPLIQGDMLQTAGVLVAIVCKVYADGRVTGGIRCNNGAPIAAELAGHLGGGGHAYASGFKVTGGRDFNEIKTDCLNKARELLATLGTDNTDETLQHTY